MGASKALMRYRREKLRAGEPLEDEAAESHDADVPLRLDLEAAMSRLTERSRAVVWLHDVEGYTHEEIAELMGMTTSFSKSQLARAHEKLRRWLGEGAKAARGRRRTSRSAWPARASSTGWTRCARG